MSNLLKLEKQRAQLEAQITSERTKLLALARKAGFASLDALASALAPLTSGGAVASRGGASASRGAKSGKGGGAVRYSEEVRAQVKAALADGKTAKSISQQFGPSIPLINVWKKNWGLTKSRKKSGRGKKSKG